MNNFLGTVQLRRLPTGPQCQQLIQCIPPHSVDGRGRKGNTGLNMAGDVVADEGRTAGFLQTFCQRFFRQGCGACHLRHRTVDGAFASGRVGNGQAADLIGNFSAEVYVNQGVFRCFVAFPNLFQPVGIVVFIFADAEHIRAGLTGIIAVGKALTVKCGGEGVQHFLRNFAGIQGLTVYRRNSGHIFRTFHTAFQLQGSNAQLLQVVQIVDQAVVLQTQGVLAVVTAVTVALAARLSTAAAVAGTAANGGRQIALTGIAHTQRTVSKNLNLNGRIFADVGNIFPTQFAAEHHAGHAHGCAEQHAGQRVHRHLSRAVQRYIGCNLPAQLNHAQILHDKGVHAYGCGVADQLGYLVDFPIGNQGV